MAKKSPKITEAALKKVLLTLTKQMDDKSFKGSLKSAASLRKELSARLKTDESALEGIAVAFHKFLGKKTFAVATINGKNLLLAARLGTWKFTCP